MEKERYRRSHKLLSQSFRTSKINLFQNDKNKTALRNLSMIIRTQKENQPQNDRLENCKKSIEYAKKAINLDLKDPESWCSILLT
jgi:hypothetical protein